MDDYHDTIIEINIERNKLEERIAVALERIALSLDSMDSRLTRLTQVAEDLCQLYERR